MRYIIHALMFRKRRHSHTSRICRKSKIILILE